MKIAIIGYGKMGKTIEKLAVERGHEIVLKATSSSPATSENLSGCDVAIEFTNPESAVDNFMLCLQNDIPVVTGSTGWNDQKKEVLKTVEEKKGRFFFASNFSVGVNIFFQVNKSLAKLMNAQPDYTPSVEEWHHIHKKDAPSGTAVSIVEQMIDKLDSKTGWSLAPEKPNENEIGVKAYREGEIFGTHCVSYRSAIDDLTIEHKAHSREGFAKGAILAAEWIVNQSSGTYGMEDLLQI
ncbi:4-hydroxy-tetrahydrodipicolinate reductase [Halocola ammonii]